MTERVTTVSLEALVEPEHDDNPVRVTFVSLEALLTPAPDDFPIRTTSLQLETLVDVQVPFYIDGDALTAGISNPLPGSYPVNIKMTDDVGGTVTKPFTVIVS